MKQTIQAPGPLATKRLDASPRGRGVIAFLFMLGAIGFADKSITGYLSVPIIKEFHLSSVQWGILSGSFFWLFSISSILFGAWSDRIGTTRVLSLVAMIWTLVQIATGFVASFPLLLLSRVALGIGEGPYTGQAMTAAAKWLPRERRGLGLALVSCGNLIGPAILTPLLIVLAASHGWRIVFLLLGICSLLWLIGWLLVGREGPGSEDAIGKEALIESRQKNAWTGLLPLLFSRNILLITLATFAAYWMQGLSVNWLAAYMINVRHLQLVWAGAAGSLVVLCTCLVQIMSSMLADRWFRRTSKLRVYVATMCAALVLTAALNYSAVLVAPVALSILCLCLQPSGAVFSTAGTLIVHLTPTKHQGTVQGVSIALATIGAIVSPILAGFLLQAAGKNLAQGFQTVYLLSALLFVFIALAAFAGIRPQGEREI
ncbi:MFS transporter [Ktedonosporobacter rubrisoli]|uniref:MFS transporter n=1 Tax=Ktedonosporobacter rubrisoli TaxID=2509675 RepID=A0A4P6JJY0_KTERU|nr:MFS transporter [Ktedonosporobacter rubrisoli]QBD75262.1 MFS transporter [Ktedonosporobacter rubrisoli]